MEAYGSRYQTGLTQCRFAPFACADLIRASVGRSTSSLRVISLATCGEQLAFLRPPGEHQRARGGDGAGDSEDGAHDQEVGWTHGEEEPSAANHAAAQVRPIPTAARMRASHFFTATSPRR